MNLSNKIPPSFLETLQLHSKSGIFCLYNGVSNKIDIRASNNIIKAIGTILENANDNLLGPKELNEDILKGNIEFCILETLSGEKNLKIALSNWTRLMKDDGVEFYRDYRNNLVNYKLIKKIINVSVENVFKYRVCCYIKSHKTETLIGIFDSMEEYDRFATMYYPNEVCDFIYANNELTSKYYIDLNKENIINQRKIRSLNK